MDSQENTPKQGNLESEKQVVGTENTVETANSEASEEEKVTSEESQQTTVEEAEPQDGKAEGEPVSETTEEQTEQPEVTIPEEETPKEEEAPKIYATKQEVLDRLKEIANSDEYPQKNELDLLKTTFYKLHLAEREAQQKEYLDNGGDPEHYQIVPDKLEESLKTEMAIIKEKRAKIFQQQEAEKEENLKKKLEIIDKIKAMATSPDEANKSFQEFKSLQQQWKEIKAVPAQNASELWRNYQLYVEQFYDLLNLNREAREYDFKKNLELKTKLCETAENLANEEDVISAFHQLQELHLQYREIGPVAKELREEIWTRFKAASTVINKRHQQHFETLRKEEEENLTKKTALCEKVEDIVAQEYKTAGEWEKHTKEIIAIQAEWKTIGFAPQKMNVKIFERFRSACDRFFQNKAEFFKQMKQRFAENAEKKKALVEKAQALADSTDWKSTSDKLIALQKEWKTIGMVPRKQGDQLWNDFITACNTFFEARNKTNASTKNTEHENLEKKRAIIAQLKELAEKADENTKEKVQELVDEYGKIGHVPYKEKDNVYQEYHDILDKLYKELHISFARRHLDNFKNNLKNMAKMGEDALDNERGRLMHRYEQLKSEITTYENNLGFLNASSKKGNNLLDEMNRKVEKLKDDCKMIREKIKAIDAENKNAE
ncbi:DUF349 domain-containing protein [Hoylesella buccalis]|uniref:DUF349 domain-containing protein n=1 Tax=Hoylesella buccalis TaxID=28127 RepID=UPI0026EC8ECF|nr:DUF349 domain-containing protein [Hoylesella buccalis]